MLTIIKKKSVQILLIQFTRVQNHLKEICANPFNPIHPCSKYSSPRMQRGRRVQNHLLFGFFDMNS